MKVHHTLICLFLWLQDGNTGLTDAEPLFTKPEGGNITVKCSFLFHGEKKLFCRNECEGDDKLIETKHNYYQRDRYRVEYDRTLTGRNTLYVSITDLVKSDSGRYTCGLEESFISDGYADFNLRVVDAPKPPRPNLTPTPSGPNLTPTPSGPNLTPTPLSTSLPPASVTTSQTEKSPEGPAYPLYIGLVLVFMAAALSVAMLIFCRNRSRKHTEPPRETVCIGAMKENTEYAEIREDGRSRAPPVEEPSLYTNVTYTTPTPVEASDHYSLVSVPVEASDHYSLVSGPAAVAPHNDEDVTYSDVNVVSSLRKTSADPTDAAVIYSAVAGQRSSPHHDAPDLYSTVAPQ